MNIGGANIEAGWDSTLDGHEQGLFVPDPTWPRESVQWAYRDVSGVVAGADDRIYVLCPDEQRIFVLSDEGDVVDSWDLLPSSGIDPAGKRVGSRRDEPTASYPHSLAACRDGSILCVDNQLNTIRKFTPDGEHVATIGKPGWTSDSGADRFFTSVARGAGPFNGVAAVAEARDGDLYVADGYRNARIHCFSADGDLKHSWGEPGDGPGRFRLPHGIALTSDDQQVVVADRENNRLVFFDRAGRYLDQWRGFTRPAALHIDSADCIVVVELGVYATVWDFLPPDEETRPPSRCSVLTRTGEVVARWGHRDASAPGLFFAPHCVTRDARGSLYVGETNRVIEVGRKMPPTHVRTLQRFLVSGRDDHN